MSALSPDENHRKTSVLVAILFLTSTGAFMAGSSMVASYFSPVGASSSTLLAGALLQIYCGLAVVGIAVAMLPLLKRYNERLARSYLGLRVLEALVIIGVGVYMVTTKREVPNYDALIYVFTASSGLIFAYLLHVSRLVPRLLSKLGLVGYAVLGIGIPVALMDLAQLDAGWGLVFVAPGGLFELFLPLLLLVKGFSRERDATGDLEAAPAGA